ncbi:MAG: preprotein translocase subunit SecE [Bacteroidota bacterium]|jgi:preprotein translocase subunit SecE|nr:preprotein translocase subunit SecE [Bacteroidota bacterium]GDX48645.1 protein translocase subunit SecE [Bacteroidota bacterium]
MEKFNAFIRESYQELMTKVSWPTWDELQNSAIIVSVAALLIGVIVLMMDAGSNLMMSYYYKAF